MNKATFNQTYLPLRQVIFMVCVALLTDQEVANDITQDVYLRLWEQRDELDNVQSPQAYAVRIARNRCLDHLKSAGERLRTSGKGAETALALQIDNSACGKERRRTPCTLGRATTRTPKKYILTKALRDAIQPRDSRATRPTRDNSTKHPISPSQRSASPV